MRGAYDKFPDFFGMDTFIDSTHMKLLRLQCTCCTVTTTSGRPHGSPLEQGYQWPSSQPLLSPQLSHNDSLWAQGITKSHREQGLDYREGKELSWCPSWSNSRWQGWSCRLVHCPGENATDPIWRVRASSEGISSWTLLKPQDRLPVFLESLMPLKTDARFMQDTSKAVWSIPYVSEAFLFHIVLLKCPIAFLKFTCCDNQTLVGCIPISAVAVDLKLKS